MTTTGYFTMTASDGQEFSVSCELVMDEDTDGSWLVYAVVPESVDNASEGMASGSIRVTDEAGKRLLGDVFSMLTGPAPSGARAR